MGPATVGVRVPIFNRHSLMSHSKQTMTPQEFLGFRDWLSPASGFQAHALL